MATPASSIKGFEVVVGYVSETTAKIGCCSLQGGTLTATCSGGSVSCSTMTERGADNSARSGLYVSTTGLITITGLSPFTRYTYTATCDGITVSGSFTTLPDDDSVDWAFLQGTCESLTSQGYTIDKNYSVMRQIVEDSSVPVLFYAHIDDNMYTDEFKYVFEAHSKTDAQTGLNNTAVDPQTGAENTHLKWDRAVAWTAWFGLLPGLPQATYADRKWFFRNVPRWAQWGDHEIAGDHCSSVKGSGTSPANYGCNRTGVAGVEYAAMETEAEELWNAYVADACRPPSHTADGGPASNTGEQYWGKAVGSVRFFSFDRNKHAWPYDAADAAGVTYGRSGTASRGTSTGATVPTKTACEAVGGAGCCAQFLGSTQITDMLNWFNNVEPFKIIFAPNGISMHNQPWSDRWPDDFDDAMGRNSTELGLLRNPKTNGTTGHTFILKGDTHALHVCSYHSDGTASGCGGASTPSGYELWEICPGTINSSPIGGGLFGNNMTSHGQAYTITAGGKVRLLDCGATQSSKQLSAVVKVTVEETASPKKLTAEMIRLPSMQIAWRGYQTATQIGNQFQYNAAMFG